MWIFTFIFCNSNLIANLKKFAEKYRTQMYMAGKLAFFSTKPILLCLTDIGRKNQRGHSLFFRGFYTEILLSSLIIHRLIILWKNLWFDLVFLVVILSCCWFLFSMCTMVCGISFCIFESLIKIKGIIGDSFLLLYCDLCLLLEQMTHSAFLFAHKRHGFDLLLPFLCDGDAFLLLLVSRDGVSLTVGEVYQFFHCFWVQSIPDVVEVLFVALSTFRISIWKVIHHAFHFQNTII